MNLCKFKGLTNYNLGWKVNTWVILQPHNTPLSRYQMKQGLLE